VLDYSCTSLEENCYIAKSLNIYSIPEAKIGKPITLLVQPGDVLIFYILKKGSKSLGSRFVGVFRVVSTWFREEKPL